VRAVSDGGEPVPDRIQFDGFDEARRRLKQIGDVERTREYKLASAEIVSEVVIPAAQANASTRMERRAAQTLVAVKSDSGGAVRLGGKFPGALGAEFGADRNQRRLGRPHGTVAPVTGWNQFKPWRGSDSGAGYFLWPAIREQEGEIINRYSKLFDELFGDEGG
jgi:hypothetical protein